jgi:hypothetical protein
MAVKPIEQAVEQGACCYKACDVIGISWRTYHRYRQTSGPVQDKRYDGAQKAVGAANDRHCGEKTLYRLERRPYE